MRDQNPKPTPGNGGSGLHQKTPSPSPLNLPTSNPRSAEFSRPDWALLFSALILIILPAWWTDFEPQSLSISEGIQRQIVLDINSAPIYQWCLLEGIGEGRATRIVRERERLGEFKSFDQLEDVPGLPINCLKKAKHILFLGNQTYESYLNSQVDLSSSSSSSTLPSNLPRATVEIESNRGGDTVTTVGGSK